MLIRFEGLNTIRQYNDVHPKVIKLLDLLEKHELIEKLEESFDELYPEGIDYDTLHDMMNHEQDEIWDMLNIELNEDLEPIFEL